MKIVKYSTEHLECVSANSELGQPHYQISENGKDVPVMIYINKDDIRLSNQDIPVNIKLYPHFDELCEIVKFLKEKRTAHQG